MEILNKNQKCQLGAAIQSLLACREDSARLLIDDLKQIAIRADQFVAECVHIWRLYSCQKSSNDKPASLARFDKIAEFL